MKRAGRIGAALSVTIGVLASNAARADERAPGLDRLNHIIIVMQENHSFDNYFGALPYAKKGPHHASGFMQCSGADHRCVDGLTCHFEPTGELSCTNANVDEAKGKKVRAFHNRNRCVVPDLDHSWLGTHKEGNFDDPNATLTHFRADGYVRQNDLTEQPDTVESVVEDETMGFYTEAEIPFYYELAQKFAISDRYFSSVLGPTFPNRSYLLAATSFGHLTTSDTFPPPGGYKPVTGTIFDLMEKHGVSWADYFQDAPQGGSFRPFSAQQVDPHFLPRALLLAQLAGAPGVPPLPQVVFVDPNFGLFSQKAENDEHPPTDIQRGQANVSQVVNALRNGPYWSDSILFITYDEHGGFYDHVTPPPAPQRGQRTPDGIAPGQCADASNQTDTSRANAVALCPALAANPTGPYPASCASFDQLGVRVPFIAVSPFARPTYVSHTVADHTSLLALIEQRFMTQPGAVRPHLTQRDAAAHTLEDMFDFVNSPSAQTAVGKALPPVADCTP